jgi:hypothetical protein
MSKERHTSPEYHMSMPQTTLDVKGCVKWQTFGYAPCVKLDRWRINWGAIHSTVWGVRKPLVHSACVSVEHLASGSAGQGRPPLSRTRTGVSHIDIVYSLTEFFRLAANFAEGLGCDTVSHHTVVVWRPASATPRRESAMGAESDCLVVSRDARLVHQIAHYEHRDREHQSCHRDDALECLPPRHADGEQRGGYHTEQRPRAR